MKRIAIIAIAALISTTTPARAVENGELALGDSNAVSINGAGGFLYSPRIVLTTAHNHILPYEIENIKVSLPGEIFSSTGKKINAHKLFLAPTYADRTFLSGGNIFSRTDDFAVIVLDEPIPLKNEVKIATKDDLDQFKASHAKANMVGYGLQTPEMRTLSNNGRNQVEVTPHRIATNFITDSEAESVIRNSLGNNAIFKQDGYFLQTPLTGSICDNDSGSGWYVDREDVRYYIGPASGGLGFPNCTANAPWSLNGSFASVSAAYKFMDLIAQAEKYIEENPYIPPKPVAMPIPAPSMVVSPKSVKNILCMKGKAKKYFSLTKCPIGYKLIKT